jgi:hypothetical protein
MKIKSNIKIEEVKSSFQEQIDKLNKELSDLKHYYEDSLKNNNMLLSEGNLSKQKELDDTKKYYEGYIKNLKNQYEDQLVQTKNEYEQKMNAAIEDLKKKYENQILQMQKSEADKVKI